MEIGPDICKWQPLLLGKPVHRWCFHELGAAMGELPQGTLDYLTYDAAGCVALFGVGVLVNVRRDA
jgi:hypothetical protein